MLDTQTPVTEVDPFASAGAPVLPTYDMFGLVEINAWFCALVTGQGKVPFDPQVHEKRFTAIDVYIQPVHDVKFPKQCECDWLAESPTWARITLPSIKALGIENPRELNGKWARVTRVDSLEKPYEKKDTAGNKTGEKAVKKTFKFVELYDSEDACRAAYVAAGGTASNANGNGHNVPAMVVEDPAKATAATFLNAIVPNAVRGKTTFADAQAAAKTIITQYAPVAAYFNETSPETIAIIEQVTGLKA